jgi:hypothetical protein
LPLRRQGLPLLRILRLLLRILGRESPIEILLARLARSVRPDHRLLLVSRL